MTARIDIDATTRLTTTATHLHALHALLIPLKAGPLETS